VTGFPTKPLSAFVKLASGGTPSKGNPEYWGGTIPWLTPKDMSRFDETTQDSVTEKAIGNGTKRAPIGSLFIAVRGMSLHNEIRIVRPDRQMTFNQDIKAITPTNRINTQFLYYAMLAQIPDLLGAVESAGHGTGVLPTDKLNALPIPELPLPEQRAIAATLGALDDKIELNRRTCETLEAMARALFRDWFVDFGPTRRKAAGATDPVTILGHPLPDPRQAAVLAASFPDSFNSDGFPVGWKLSTIGEISKNHSETMDLKKRQRVIFVNTGDVSQGAFLHANYSDAKGLPGQAKKKIEVGDILYSEIRPKNKRFAFVEFSAPDHVVSTKFMVLRTISTVSPTHLYFLVASPEAVEEFNRIAESRSGTFPQITFESIKHYPVTVASDDVMKAFNQILELFYGLQRANEQENQTLAQTRDLLLPRLMSGELRVADLASTEKETAA
jgi:type I restriction enzyme S subunit